uniref:NR LBD domain-containing protein n=1 Tax=Meloidogyne incognita TaxID=6306 RepID=A0A914N8T6_MELIC
MFTKSVAHFKRVSLTNVEFALLIAIILSKSGGENLSPEGKDLLYDESAKYTNILLRYNQRRLGLIEGAQRLAECISLINRSIENAYAGRLMLSHQIKHYSMDPKTSMIVPPEIISCHRNQTPAFDLHPGRLRSSTY